ncbi:glycosyltransferase family 4 protein, partial [Candidatus Woesearchaeota archaeon]|nr:glycosyltransferase family 4 protein [Candidatus Woesearchaeota archaeon]
MQEWIKLKGWLTGTFGAIWTNISRLLPYDRIIAVSNATKQRLIEQDMSKKSVDVIYNGIDTALVKGIAAQKQTEPSIICSARLIATKRIDVLIRAIAVLKKTLPNVKLMVLGDGAERKNLQQLILKLKLQKNVQLARTMRFSEQLKIMKRHHVFCLPSDVEGFGMAVVAGMAAGLPVVCTDIPVLREVTDNQGALHFKAGDVHDLAEKLSLLLTDKAVYAQKQREALLRAKRFEWSTLAKEAEQSYREALR